MNIKLYHDQDNNKKLLYIIIEIKKYIIGSYYILFNN